jgi:hypothetical membrane protein
MQKRGKLMMSRRSIGLIALVTPFWFLAVYLIMAALRPDYSYLTNAISELGSVHAPHGWYWNALDYVVPGFAIALLGIELQREFTDANRVAWAPAVALVVSGFFIALSGVFPADLTNMGGTTTQIHIVGAYGCYIAFLIAGFGFPFIFRKYEQWRWLVWPSLVLVLLSIVTGFLESGSTSMNPYLGQRLAFACYFAWLGLSGFALARSRTVSQCITWRCT